MRQYPPGPRSWFPGAPLLAFGRDALGYLEAAAREHGDIVHLRLGPRHFFLLNHPDHVKDVLVTTDATAADDVRELIDAAMMLFGPITFAFASLVERLPTTAARRFVRARQRLDARVYRLLRERRSGGDDRGDLLSMLLLAQDTEEGTESDGAGLTDRQIRDEVVTIFLAGHET